MLETLVTVARESWQTLGLMAPYLLFGFFVAGVLSVLISPRIVEQHLGGAGLGPVLKAALFGVPLPLCSCGVIPVSASLRRHGASRGATTAFLISTPQTGVDSIFVTFSLLGPVFAVFRPLAALLSGVLGGSLVALWAADGQTDNGADDGTNAADSENERRGGVARVLGYGFVTLPRDIGRPLLIGLLLAGVISTVVPKDYLAGVLGTGIGAMVVMMALGIPVYVCATASVPVAAVLIAKGISSGAALVFLMTGPATNAATIATVWKVLGWRTTVIYLATVALSALGAGVLLDHIYAVSGVAAITPGAGMLPAGVRLAAAVVLLAVLAVAILRPLWPRAAPPAETLGGSITLSITGMRCAQCAQSIQRALGECRGVDRAEVDFESSRAIVRGKDLDLARLRRTVEELGYQAAESGD